MRRAIEEGEPLRFARLRTGGQLRVVDASSFGALTETRERLLPGRHLDVHIVASPGRVLVRARVTRAYVWQLQADAVDYRAALAFDQAIDVRPGGYVVPFTALAQGDALGTAYPAAAPNSEIEFTDRVSA
jgi:hypothetical protein